MNKRPNNPFIKSTDIPDPYYCDRLQETRIIEPPDAREFLTAGFYTGILFLHEEIDGMIDKYSR